MLAAILIIGDKAEVGRNGEPATGLGSFRRPWVAVEVLGTVPVARVAEALRSACDALSVITHDAPGREGKEIQLFSLEESTTHRFAKYRREGFGAILIVKCGAYVELDVAELHDFHREQSLGITRAFSDDGPLDVWMVDPAALPERAPIFPALSSARSAVYRSHGYVNRLQTGRDYRRLVLDSFDSRCRLRPEGSEIRPRIWVCNGARIERSARLVAPAFIGPHVQIADECLITRGSNVERNSYVDFGTAVEDSSILSNSYLGIGLDLAHSVVDGCNLLNLQHNVNLQVSDPVVMRRNSVSGSTPGSPERESHMALSSAE